MEPDLPTSSLIPRKPWCAGAVVVFVIAALGPACDRTETDSYRAAREYFYGTKEKSGYLVASWRQGDRAERLGLRRAGYGLSDQWEYIDEELAVSELGSFEYFFRYSSSFRNTATGSSFIREESYYSIGDELWEPVPLTTKSYTLSADGRSEGPPITQTLWNCDFDAFLEDRDIECIRRARPRK